MGSAGSPAERWPFVARDPEISILDELLLSGRGAVIVGDAGVGKSRLLATIADRAESLGWRVHQVAGSRSLARVPFGAFAAVLGASVSGGGGDLFSILQGRARGAADTRGRAGARRPSTTRISSTRAARRWRCSLLGPGFVVMASVRRGEPCPEAVTALWKDDLAGRARPRPARWARRRRSRAAGGARSARRQRHPPPPRGEDRSGNLLFLRELVRVGLARGTLVERGGVWMWDGPITDAPAVADLVRTRLMGLERGRAASRRCRGARRADRAGAARLVERPAAVRSCEAKGILVTERCGRRLEARLEHPLYADVVRDAMRPSDVHAAREGCRRRAAPNGSEEGR